MSSDNSNTQETNTPGVNGKEELQKCLNHLLITINRMCDLEERKQTSREVNQNLEINNNNTEWEDFEYKMTKKNNRIIKSLDKNKKKYKHKIHKLKRRISDMDERMDELEVCNTYTPTLSEFKQQEKHIKTLEYRLEKTQSIISQYGMRIYNLELLVSRLMKNQDRDDDTDSCSTHSSMPELIPIHSPHQFVDESDMDIDMDI